MVLDSGTVVSVVGFVSLIAYVRLCFGRVFARFDDLVKGVGAELVILNNINLKLASTPGVVNYTVMSTEADGTMRMRHDGTDTDLPFAIWKDLETGVPGQHWFLTNGSVTGYLEN